MRLLGYSFVKFYKPCFTKSKAGHGCFFKFARGATICDSACVFWNHISFWAKVGRLFLGGCDIMWG